MNFLKFPISTKSPFHMDFIWNPPGIHMESTWNPHGIHLESIWNEYMSIPYGIHGIFLFHVDSILYSIWNPCGFHGIFSFHMDSTWIPYGMWGQGKLLQKCLTILQLCHAFLIRIWTQNHKLCPGEVVHVRCPLKLHKDS